MKRLISLLVVMCMLIGCVSIFAEEAYSGEEYYIDVELKYYTSDRLSPIFLPMKTNCPEITFEIYYPDGTLYSKHTYPGNFFENGLYSDYCNYYHYDGDYLLVFSYEDCRTEIVFTIENSDRYKAWFERVYGFKPEEKEPENTESTNKGGSSVKVGVIGVSENEIELYAGDVKEINVVSSKSVTVEVEDESVVEANLSNGVLSIKALKMGESEIWLRNSDTYTPVSVTVVYGTDPGEVEEIEKEELPYPREINVVKSLEIMQGYDDGTFKSEGTLTRAEAGAIMVRFLNLEGNVQQDETIFTDVKSSHWASGYINVAVEEGIINGQGDGTFAPEEKVTYHQFVKMLVCALGYEPMAEANGSWAGWGYIFTGAKIGLTKGISATTDEYITRETAARLIFKALTIDLMEELEAPSDTNGKTHTIAKDKCILTEYLGYQKVEGFVWNDSAMTVKRNYAAEPYYEGGQKISFMSLDENIQNLVNENIVAYIKPYGKDVKTEDAVIAIVEKME
ncbi:MAG: S-layer homology domain-containing protein [Clostridia bacterium]|nr:S-layer homology domain-containing protein [Clostridia bacterium]